MARRLGPYAPLSATYASDDSLIAAGEDAELLYCRGLAFCSTSNSDGFITQAQLERFVGAGMPTSRKRSSDRLTVQERADALCEHGAWEKVDGGYVVRSWLKWNKSAEELGQALKKDRVRKANARTADRNPETIPEDVRAESERIPDGHPPDSETDSERSPASRARAYAPARAEHSTTHHSTTRQNMPGEPTPAADLTVNQRSKRLTDAYAEAEPMCKWPAVNGIVKRAIEADRWPDDAIRDALLRLAKEGRSVTVDSLRTELNGLPARRTAGHQPYRNPIDESVYDQPLEAIP